MVRYELPFMEVSSLVDRRVAEETLQKPKPYYATMPLCWTNAREGRVVKPRVGLVGHTTSPI